MGTPNTSLTSVAARTARTCIASRDLPRFPWHEVTRVAHYRLEVTAMTRPMMVREDEALYGKRTGA